jgi:hypothetical protein
VTRTPRSTATEVTAMGFVRTRVSGDVRTRYIALGAGDAADPE